MSLASNIVRWWSFCRPQASMVWGLWLLTWLLLPPSWCAGQGPKAPGTLILCGGGRPYNEDVLDVFWQRAGGAQAAIVVVPTAHREMDQPETVAKRLQLLMDPWRKRGVLSLEVCHTMSREEADSESFVEPLRKATAIWFGGGEQQRLLDVYHDTRFHREVIRLYERGGTVGGSSAGTAVQSELTILGEDGTRTELRPGFGLLDHVVVDQHFLARKRTERLFQAVQPYKDFFGIGIDEYTAAVICDRHLSVVGASTVTIIEPAGQTPLRRTFALKAGERYVLGGS